MLVPNDDVMDIADYDFLDEEFLDDDDGSDFDFEIEAYYGLFSHSKKRLFGGKEPLHVIIGSGKCADVILWRNKLISVSIVAGATYLWILLKYMGYNLVTIVCQWLLVSLGTLFSWSTLYSLANISPPELYRFALPEGLFARIALSMEPPILQVHRTLEQIGEGNGSKEFISVAGTLFAISVASSWLSTATLLYTSCMLLLTVPVIYEKNEDIIDSFADELLTKLKMKYRKWKENFLHKHLGLASAKDGWQQKYKSACTALWKMVKSLS